MSVVVPLADRSSVLGKRRDRRPLVVSRWVKRIRHRLPIDQAIDRVRARICDADPIDQDYLTFELKLLLTYAGIEDPRRYDEALELIDRMIAQKPDDVLYPMSKAALYFYSLDDPEKALSCIDFALERAFRTNFFRRQALGYKARILLKLKRGQELGQVLEQIMSLDDYQDFPDTGRERDFVDSAEPGLIPSEVLERYNRYYPSSPSFQARLDWLADLRGLPREQRMERIQLRIRTADPEEKASLAFSLGRACTEAKRHGDALHWYDNAMEWDSTDPRPAIRKAIVLLADLDKPEQALAALQPALERAFRTRAFRRQALGVKARILLRLGRGDELGSLLEQIMSLDKRPEDFDVGRERDFVDSAPPGIIPREILARYNEFCPKLPGR